MPADCILIEGTCVMDESIITGESVPVNKTALQQDDTSIFNPNKQETNILFCGTKCLRSRNETGQSITLAKALVYQTGFNTLKGGLVRAILYTKNSNFSFNRDSMKFLIVLFILGGM